MSKVWLECARGLLWLSAFTPSECPSKSSSSSWHCAPYKAFEQMQPRSTWWCRCVFAAAPVAPTAQRLLLLVVLLLLLLLLLRGSPPYLY